MQFEGSVRLKGRPALALACALILASEAKAHVPALSCPAPFGRLLSERVFSGYDVPVRGGRASPALPDVRAGKARLYRTAIRNGAKAGPNFAGKFIIIPIGCGAATICVAIADATTGKVYFPPELSSGEALLVDTGNLNIETLNYRRNSRLLILVGSPNDQRKRAGMSYYVWSAGRLKLIRFVPAAQLCGLPETTQF
jgi:hypothetical protein